MGTEMNLESCKCASCSKNFNVSLIKGDGEIYTCSSCRENSEED